MGVPSMSIMLVETIKLLHYAGAKDVCFVRIGTSGGIGVAPGTVIVSSGAINGLLEKKHIQFIKGNIVSRELLHNRGATHVKKFSKFFLEITLLGVKICRDFEFDIFEAKKRFPDSGKTCVLKRKIAFLRLFASIHRPSLNQM